MLFLWLRRVNVLWLAMFDPSDLHQQRHRSTLVDLQDFSVLGSQQDVTVTQRDGSDRRVVLQQQT